jgi:surfactin synthase thioesterase subunit
MTEQTKHIIIYSHGFGVERGARGMFTDIAAAFPDTEHVLFDYNIPNQEEHTLMVRPLSEQKDIFLAEIAQAKKRHPDSVIDIIAHSLGSVVAALAQSSGVRKTILLAPPLELASSSLQRFAGRPGSIIDPDGLSRLARRDGSFTLVPAAFWKEREAIDPVRVYNSFSEKTELTVVLANQDDVVSAERMSSLSPKIRVIGIDGDHDFRNESRAVLVETLRQLL